MEESHGPAARDESRYLSQIIRLLYRAVRPRTRRHPRTQTRHRTITNPHQRVDPAGKGRRGKVYYYRAEPAAPNTRVRCRCCWGEARVASRPCWRRRTRRQLLRIVRLRYRSNHAWTLIYYSNWTTCPSVIPGTLSLRG